VENRTGHEVGCGSAAAQSGSSGLCLWCYDAIRLWKTEMDIGWNVGQQLLDQEARACGYDAIPLWKTGLDTRWDEGQQQRSKRKHRPVVMMQLNVSS